LIKKIEPNTFDLFDYFYLYFIPSEILEGKEKKLDAIETEQKSKE